MNISNFNRYKPSMPWFHWFLKCEWYFYRYRWKFIYLAPAFIFVGRISPLLFSGRTKRSLRMTKTRREPIAFLCIRLDTPDETPLRRTLRMWMSVSLKQQSISLYYVTEEFFFQKSRNGWLLLAIVAEHRSAPRQYSNEYDNGPFETWRKLTFLVYTHIKSKTPSFPFLQEIGNFHLFLHNYRRFWLQFFK